MFCNLTVNTRTSTTHFCFACYAKDVTPVLNVPALLVQRYLSVRCFEMSSGIQQIEQQKIQNEATCNKSSQAQLCPGTYSC